MVNKIEIDGVHMTVDDDLRKYVLKKIARLDKYIPRHARTSAHMEVKLKEGKNKGKNERTCEVLIHLPHENITVNETTINIYAAVDIAEEKLKAQLHKYKELHADPRLRQRMLARLKRSPVEA
ncbi:MAG TPA: ribosome-associated translation inhibitor RaiA [Candidatus Saccharimonadales bacterium]|jgi:ribosomal subunit interface protein|nr:ribosome-associated translation inhibitor RaiA [Candidatus Saccharimonadales bacterium]